MLRQLGGAGLHEEIGLATNKADRNASVDGDASHRKPKGEGEACQNFLNHEGFDPGSERTLAAWFRHASRARKFPSGSD
jgi:hypothetical protein